MVNPQRSSKHRDDKMYEKRSETKRVLAYDDVDHL